MNLTTAYLENLIVKIEKIDGEIERIRDYSERQILEYASRRREINLQTRKEHVSSTFELGRKCPCCMKIEIVTSNDTKVEHSEFDHFFANSLADAFHTWLICKDCHDRFTYGKTSRPGRIKRFLDYQNLRKNLPGRQGILFI